MWFEQGWGRFGRQDVFLSRAWVQGLPETERVREFRSLWRDMAAMSASERRLRSLQFRLWSGALGMLDLLFGVLHIVMRNLGLRGLPHPSFWCQRFAWSCKRAWFGLDRKTHQSEHFGVPALRVESEPLFWKSWIFGVWALYPARCLHPSWRVLVESEAVLEG